MTQYVFDNYVLESTFKGSEFYNMKQNYLFLTDVAVVEGILCQGKKIRQQLKNIQTGQTLRIGDALITHNEPLVIKKGGPNVTIADDKYTLNRLTGMCAAFAAQQGGSFNPKCAMAVSLGLDVTRDRILYYSATPGAEHFPDLFSYHPLLCAIKQLDSGKVTKGGKTLATLLTEAKTVLNSKLVKFGTGGSRGVVELEKALTVVRSLSGGSGPSASR